MSATFHQALLQLVNARLQALPSVPASSVYVEVVLPLRPRRLWPKQLQTRLLR